MDQLLDKIPAGIPRKVAMNLEIPDVLTFSRRSSPRAEDMAKNRVIKKQESTRQRLSLHQSFDDAVELLKQSENVVVLSGAGISTSVGIPDFRSDKGLYKRLSEELHITEPEEFFSNTFFTENPLDFFKHVKGVLPRAIPCTDGSYRPVDPRRASVNERTAVPKYSPTHAFLTLLQSKGKLLTNYTQNIDGLELAAGLDPAKFIQCHGSWDTANCMTCGKSASARKYLPIAFSGGIPFCKCSTEEPKVKAKLERKSRSKLPSGSGKKRKRRNEEEDNYGSDHSSDQYDNSLVPKGLLKPDITFFEDPITDNYQTRLKSDKQKVDLLIVVGTSLKVAPIQQMLYQIPPSVPQIYISKERFSGALCSLPGVQVDIELLGEADVIVEELCHRAGWTDGLQKCLWKPGLSKIKGYTEQPSSIEYKSGIDHAPSTKKIKRAILSDKTEPPIRKQRVETSGDQHTTEESVTLTHQTSRYTNSVSDSKPTVTTTTVTTATKTTIPPHLNPPETTSLTPSQPSSHQISIHEEQKTSSSATESKVKIELVEGTSHQWRVTRKK